MRRGNLNIIKLKGRLKSIAQETSKDVGKLSEASLIGLGRAAELFIENMVVLAANDAAKSKDKAVKKQHILNVVESEKGSWMKKYFQEVEPTKEPTLKKCVYFHEMQKLPTLISYMFCYMTHTYKLLCFVI
jgi:hypothetical protein